MNIKGLIFTVFETILKVIILAAAVMLILKGVTKAYDFGYKVFADEPVSPNNGRTITVGVADSATVEDVAAMLEEKGLINDQKLFLVQEYLSAYHGKIVPGIYDLGTDMTANEMLAILSSGEVPEEKMVDVTQSSTEDSDVPTDEYYDEGVMEDDGTEEAPEEGASLETEGEG